MPKKNFPTDFDSLKTHVISLFDSIPDDLAVDPGDQEKEIELLKQTTGSGRFFFTVDLVNFEIDHCFGVQRWLGYHEKEFTLKQYWNTIHPGKQMSLMSVAMQLYNSLCKGKYKLDYMVQRYSSRVPLRHYDGRYLLFQKTSSVFQFDKNNRLTSYMNEFTRLGSYKNEPLEPDFFTSLGGDENERGGEVLQKTIEQFLGMKVFSQGELQVARIIAYSPENTQAAIAKKMDVSPHTIDTFCKRFLNKAREFFRIDFTTAAEAAVYLKREGLL